MRYGENPHQQAAFYLLDPNPLTDYVTVHQGKQLSYNNLVDMEAAWRCVIDFEAPTAVIVKHTNPCGVASHDDLVTAFRRARKVDPVSAFGGIIAFNREVDEETAAAINEAFAELVIAPSYSEAARKKFKRKKNLRVISIEIPESGLPPVLELKRLDHGLLVQERDEEFIDFDQWELQSERQPTQEEIDALQMAWKMVKHVKSNAIVYANAEGAVGIGAGQMSRVDSAIIGISKAEKAELQIKGTAMASDAFFPFRDSIDAAAEAGVTAIVEPGGSIRDEEVIQAANDHGIALFFTNTRHFKH
jgi:phosphoribosylaminoimidazolecarboxamide formyltransferase/IMP cyclohydrolase